MSTVYTKFFSILKSSVLFHIHEIFQTYIMLVEFVDIALRTG